MLHTGFWSRFAVTAPDKRELLGAGTGGPGEENGFGVAVTVLEGLVDDLIIEVGVVILSSVTTAVENLRCLEDNLG